MMPTEKKSIPETINNMIFYLLGRCVLHKEQNNAFLKEREIINLPMPALCEEKRYREIYFHRIGSEQNAFSTKLFGPVQRHFLAKGSPETKITEI